MQSTEHYGYRLPQQGENARVTDLNFNTTKMDNIEYNTRRMIAPLHDINATYNTGDKVEEDGELCICKEDNVTGAFDPTKWDVKPVSELLDGTSQHIYSTQEQVVGKWIDGSDVYEKSFKADNIADDSNHVLDATLTQSAITLLPGTEIIISCTGTYNTDFISTVSDNTFGRVIANVNGLNASIVGYSYLSSQLGTCTLYVTARYLKKSV